MRGPQAFCRSVSAAEEMPCRRFGGLFTADHCQDHVAMNSEKETCSKQQQTAEEDGYGTADSFADLLSGFFLFLFYDLSCQIFFHIVFQAGSPFNCF